MVIISLIFLKNQTRPITNLARAAERFGKGEIIEEGSHLELIGNKGVYYKLVKDQLELGN